MEASKKFISVTHFINPQLFWYHSTNVPNEQFREIILLEQDLVELYKNKSQLRHYRPQVGDKIAVRFLAWNKFIRAQVQSLLEFNSKNNEELIVWALDYGFPFQTKLDHVRRLPPQYAQHIDHMRCGGIVDILPAENEFDFMEKCAVMTEQKNWHQRACDQLEKLLTDAASITFIEQFQAPGDQFWGQLIIVNHKGAEFNARDYLIAINFALDAGPNFREQCLTLEAANISPWLSNNGNNKFKANTLNTTVSSTLNINSAIDLSRCSIVDDGSYNDFAKRKVEDWHARNEQCSALMPFESPIESSAEDLDDISFNDSVSIKNHATAALPRQQLSSSISGSLASAGAKSKYADQRLPPKPSFMAFKINPIEAPNVATSSELTRSPFVARSEAKSSRNNMQFLSEDALIALDENRDFRTPPQITSSPKMTNELAATDAASTPPASITGMSSHRRKLLEMRQKLISQGTLNQNTASRSPSTVGSDDSTPKYQPLQESTYTYTNNSQVDPAHTKKTRNVSISEVSTTSSHSYKNTRSKQLNEFRQRIATKEAENKNMELKDEKLKQLRPAHTDNDDTSSIASRVSTRKAKYLMNLRSKFQENNSNQSIPKENVIDKESSVLFKKVPIEPTATDIPFEFPDFAAISKSLKTTHKKDIDHLPMVPAGFDLTRMNRYNDEENHWHRKKTTRHDHVPHDANLSLKSSTAEEQLFNSSNFSDQWNPSSNGGVADRDDRSSKDQNFRHTRAHNDKYKEEQKAIVVAQKHLLDTTVPDIHESTIKPCVEQKKNVSVDITTVSPQHSDYSSLSTSKSRPYRRVLKEPSQQMDKVEQILRRANLEKEIGNQHILDLNNLNLSANKTDSDSYSEAVSSSGSEETSNKTALIKTRQIIKNQASPKPEATFLTQTQEKLKEEKLLSEQIKLDRLMENLSSELNLPLKKTTTVIAQPQQIREIAGEARMQTKFIDHLVLAHSEVPLHPIERISDAFFLQEIHDEMVNMHFTKVYRIQAYAWSHLLRGNSLFVVNPKHTGKTFCYIPSICSLVSYRIQTTMLPETYGPIAIILVPSSTHVESVFRDCRRLLVRIKEKVVVVPSFGMRNANEVKIQLLNSCGILIATPANLLRLLCDNENELLINPARLQQLVIDDMHLMLSRSKSDLEAVLRAVFKLCKKAQSDKLPLQLVATSQDWDSLMIAMIRRSNQPLLLMGDFLEAAVYGRADLSIKLKPRGQKIESVIRFIEEHPLDLERLLIFCNCDEDVDNVVSSLTSSGYACIGYYSNSTAEVRVTIDEWKQKTLFSQILVCSDASFTELQIQNVQNLIHYSMPAHWTKFTYRFSSLAKTYENLVALDFLSPNKTTAIGVKSTAKAVAHSLILLDEDNSIQLPRLMTFMKKHKQQERIPPDILAVSKRVQVEREQDLVQKGTPMCPYVLEFGDCDEQRCYYRHNLTSVDIVTRTDGIPTAGDMRILILRVISPTHYIARLLQHKAPNSTKWHNLRRSNEAAVFGMQLNMYYTNPENLVIHWPPQVNDMCIYKIADNFQRAHIIEVVPLKQGVSVSVVQKLKVTVRLIDLGKICDIKSDELFVCADNFKEFPAQAIDIRFVGLVPFDNERTWDSRATRAVSKWIMSDIKKAESVHVSINFALAKTIWVNNVIVMEQLPTVKQYIYRINLRRSLVEKNFALFASAERKSIREIAEELDLLQVFSESEESETEFQSCNNDSSLMKFSFNDSHGSSSTSASVAKEAPKNIVFDSIENVEENWDNLNEKVRSDDEIYLPLTSNPNFDVEPNLRNPTENLVATNKNTSTHDEWCILPLNQVTKIEIGDENENGNWDNIYVQIIENLHTQQFEQLSDIIHEHVEALQQKLPLEPFDESWFQPMQNCIIKYNERYLRAKLYKIYGGAMHQRIYRFYLCDYACFETIKADEIYNDRLYTTTKEIIEFTPYQSLHCTLAGIQLDRFAKRYQVSQSYLFAYAVATRCNASSSVAKELKINSYEILLYECENEYDFNTAVMLNKALVENSVATLDPDTKHFLELEVNVDLNGFDMTGAEQLLGNAESRENNDLLKFEEIMQCMQTHFEMEAEERALENDSEEDEVMESNAAKVRKTLRETKAICSAAMEKQRKELSGKQQQRKQLISHTVTEQTIEDKVLKEKPKQQKHICESDEELLISSSTSDTNSADSSLSPSSTSDSKIYTPAPPLTVQLKRPQTTWYETDFHIYLSIHTPDIDEYYLEVTANTLIFAAVVNEEQQGLVLNLLGTVEPKYVSHELRGLNVVVRLVKSIFMKWPRLLQQSTKFPWLTYNLNTIDTFEIEHLLPQQRLHMALQETARINAIEKATHYDTDSDDDGERNLYQTFTPIYNSEDIHDPTAEIF